MMEMNEYVWCFLGVAVILLVMVHSYPMVLTKGPKRDFSPPKERFRMPPKQKAQYTSTLGHPQATREPSRMQAVRENFNSTATNNFQQFANRPQMSGGGATMPVAYQTAGVDPRRIIEPMTQAPQNAPMMRYSDNQPQQMHQAPLNAVGAYGAHQGGHQGPPPPIETNPRRQQEQANVVPLTPQGMATPQQELERMAVNAAATHGESMSGDNFFASGGLSPANGSEFGSPF